MQEYEGEYDLILVIVYPWYASFRSLFTVPNILIINIY